MKKIVVFASGHGSNFQALIDAANRGQIKAEISGLITNKKSVTAIDRAENHNIPFRILRPAEFDSPGEYAEAMLEQLLEWEPNLIVLAGYLLKVPENVVDAFQDRIINIHPSLLPKYSGKGFYGSYVHQAVLDNEEKETGCTIHIVNNEYDSGPVIAQARVPVLENDDAQSLSKRVRAKEIELLPEVVSLLVNK